jgi:predicted nuclease with RNAse H fold
LPGERARRDELALVRAGISGIRFTPDQAAIGSHAGRYYEWVEHGFELYAELEHAAARTGWDVIECFPTASFTRLGGPRQAASRALWSRTVLRKLPVDGLSAATNQDERDAVMAALTARAYAYGEAERYGEIVVPRSPGP